MPVEVSVVVEATPTTNLRLLVGSLDLQSMHPSRFELVLAHRGCDQATLKHLSRLAASRPNVRVVGQDEELLPAGGFVLIADPQQRLFPEALERLSSFARKHDLDVVAGRVVRPRLPLMTPFLADAAVLERSAQEVAISSGLLLAGRDLLHGHDDTVTLDTSGARVGVLAEYPAADDPRTADLTPITKVTIEHSALRWYGSDLMISLSGTASPSPDQEGRPIVLLRQLGTHLCYILPPATEDETSESDLGATTTWRTTVQIDPFKAAAGDRLPSGVFELDVILTAPNGASAPAPVRGTKDSEALFDDGAILVRAGRTGALQIDVGPTRHSLVRGADPAHATVTETSAGSVLRVTLPETRVQTSQALPGSIALGQLSLPAQIETDTGVAVLTAFVSGLPGTQPISAKFGRAAMEVTGLSLIISPVGGMSVEARQPPAAADTSKSATPRRTLPSTTSNRRKAGPRKKKRRQAKGPVARLRRAVPRAVEPLVARLRQSHRQEALSQGD